MKEEERRNVKLGYNANDRRRDDVAVCRGGRMNKYDCYKSSCATSCKKKSDKEFKNERGNYEFVKKNVKLASTNPRH